jgi:glycosyltransferase involved in cell wall biosynthesis
MRFAMITPHGDPLGRIGEPDIGGQCVYVRELSAQLAKAGHEIHIYTRARDDGKPIREEFAPGATVVRVRCGPAGFIPKEDLKPYLPEFVERIGGELTSDTILHSHYWDGGYVAGFLCGGRRWFHTTHSIGRLKQAALPDGAQYRYDSRIRIETEIYHECDCVIALTQTEKQQISDLYGAAPERIAVIPPGVNTEVFVPSSDKAAVRRELALPDEPVIVFTLGRLDERKGFDLFLRAAGVVARRDDLPPTLFVMSAGDGSVQEATERTRLEGIIKAEELDDVLRWLPVLPETLLPHYYGAADVFVLPSRYEPFGIVMLEAMACGIPVVATSAGGPATVIEPNVNGFLVEPTDTEAFAHVLATVIEDPVKRQEYGQRGRLTVEERYSWERIADRHLAAYKLGTKDGSGAR